VSTPEQRQWIQLQALTQKKIVPKLSLQISLMARRMILTIARGKLGHCQRHRQVPLDPSALARLCDALPRHLNVQNAVNSEARTAVTI